MRRTEEEFKIEVLERSDRQIKIRKARMKKLVTTVSAAAAVCIIAAGAWVIGINGGSKMNNSSGPEGMPSGDRTGNVDNSGTSSALSGNDVSGKNSAIVTIEVHIQEGDEVVSRCYTSKEKLSQMTAAIQQMENLKKQEEEIIDKMEEAIKKPQEEIQNGGEENRGEKKYSITVTREDGTVTSYEIMGIDGTYYELKQKIELTRQYMDMLQTLVDTLATD